MKFLGKTLFGRILLSFALTLLLVLVILGMVLFLGYQQSTRVWAESRVNTIRSVAEEFFFQEFSGANPLLEFSGEPRILEGIPQDIPIFLYDRNQTLIASNRGSSRHRGFGLDNLVPMVIDGQVVGYYLAGSTQFRNDTSNVLFLNALTNALVVGSLGSLIIALGIGFFFSRSLVKPASQVSFGINRFAQGDLTHRIPEVGTQEIAKIASSANLLAEQLQQEQEIRAQWAQDITHDMRTPIASIRARIEAFQDGVFEPTGERLESLLEELSRIEGLISDLEELTRLETPELRLEVQEISLDQFAQLLEKQFNSRFTSREKQIDFLGPNIKLQADESLVYRAASNLITNALEYSYPKTPVQVTWGETTQGIFLEVCNTGPTLDSEEQQRIFARLYRGNSGRTTQGSGLGLTITAQIMKLHDGEVQVTSDQNQTCFRLVFPITE